MGTKLYETFLRAGLPAPEMMAATPVVGGTASAGYDHLVQVLRSLLPLIAQHGIARTDEIGIETLAERLRAEAAAHDRVVFMSRIVGAWARVV